MMKKKYWKKKCGDLFQVILDIQKELHDNGVEMCITLDPPIINTSTDPLKPEYVEGIWKKVCLDFDKHDKKVIGDRP